MLIFLISDKISSQLFTISSSTRWQPWRPEVCKSLSFSLFSLFFSLYPRNQLKITYISQHYKPIDILKNLIIKYVNFLLTRNSVVARDRTNCLHTISLILIGGIFLKSFLYWLISGTIFFGQSISMTIFLMANGFHTIFFKDQRDYEFFLQHTRIAFLDVIHGLKINFEIIQK